MIAQIQNFIELSFVTCIILFIDPFEFIGVAKLLSGAFIVFLGRVAYEVFLTRPITKFLRHTKKKLFTKKVEKENE